MTDTTTEETSAPWPVPAGTLASEDLMETIESLVFLGDALEFSAVNLLDKRPEKGDPLRDVWVHDLAVLIDRLETVVDKVKEVQHAAAVEFCGAMPFPCPSNVSFADTRPLVPRFPKNRTAWDNASLAADIRARIAAQVEDATAGDPAAMQAYEITMGQAEKIVTLSGGNAKTTGIKALGLDPDDYCQSEKQDPIVQVVKS